MRATVQTDRRRNFRRSRTGEYVGSAGTPETGSSKAPSIGKSADGTLNRKEVARDRNRRLNEDREDLTTQLEALRHAQFQLEVSRDRYQRLHEFSPVAY